jgi:hypothetical protein
MPELIQIIEHLEIFIGVGCLVYGISQARREIWATWKRQQDRGIAFTPGDSKKFSISKSFDLSFVLFSSALFSLLLIDSFIPKSGISDFELFVSAFLITIATTGLLFAMWYFGKAELGIAIGAILTISCIFVNPKGNSYTWLSISILIFIAGTMWIYEFGNPLQKTNRHEKKLISLLIILTIFFFPTIDLGVQFHYNLLQNENIPKRFKIEDFKIEPETNIKYFIEQKFSRYKYKENGKETEKLRNLKEQKFLYTALSDIYLGDKFYLDNYLSLNKIYKNYFLSSDIRSEIENDTSLNKNKNQDGEELRKIFDRFVNMNRGDKEKFLANRLQWIYPVGVNDKRVDIRLRAINNAQGRFIELANARTCNALLHIGNPKNFLDDTDFNYDKEAQPREYQKEDFFNFSQQFQSSNEPNCSYEKEFKELIEISNKPFSNLLLEQIALPYKEEAYLAMREYNNLANDILHDKYKNNKIDYLDKFYEADIDEGTIRAFINYFTGDRGEENYRAFKKLIKISKDKVDFKVDFFRDDKIRDRLQEVGNIIDEYNKFKSTFSCTTEEKKIVTVKGIVNFLRTSIACLREQDINKIQKLVNSTSGGEYALYYLFDNDVIPFTDYDDDQQKEIFPYFKNPIREVILNKVDSFFEGEFNEEKELKDKNDRETKQQKNDIFDSWKTTIEEFDHSQQSISTINTIDESEQKDKEQEQEQILFNIAYSLYDSIDNSFLSSLNKIVIAATFINLLFGQIVSFLFQLPLSLAAIVLALYAAQILVTRDRLGTILLGEKSRQAKSRYTIGKTDMLRGRDSTISEMKKRAGRGWSSIAIVGRRGVGKTRILYELIQPDYSYPHPKGITAWVSAPTKFDESEFVESVLEGLTADIEYTVAQTLGAKPLEIRQSETNQTIIGIVIYSLCLLIFASVAVSVFPPSQGLTPDKGTFTILLVGSVIVCSIACLIFHYINLQPVNLSSWLERDRASNPQTALLYRDMRRIHAFLEQRRTSPSASGKKESISYLSIILMSVGASTILNFLVTIISFWFVAFIFGITKKNLFSDITPIQASLFILITILLIIALVLALKREVARMRGYSLITLVSEYREFLEKVVYRIRQGALGTRPDEDFEIIVCIDELDKIVDAGELRNFIRRIKVIFEIPGVYYYLSLSEDALRAFYLGTAEGKNEVDSAFDHIIYVPPVDCDLGEEIARVYLNKHSSDLRKPGLERTIAAASYGVPRDILRRCDELVAKGNIKDIPLSQVCDDLRKKLAELAYGEEILTKQETIKFINNDIYIVFQEVEIFLSKDCSNLKALRVVLAIWLLALLALSTDSIDEQWRQTSEDLRKIGYRIANENPQNLIEELRHIQEEIWSL